MDNVTPIKPSADGDASDFDRILKADDSVLAARAILECYIQTIPDERADDRYVLWAVRDKLDEASAILDKP